MVLIVADATRLRKTALAVAKRYGGARPARQATRGLLRRSKVLGCEGWIPPIACHCFVDATKRVPPLVARGRLFPITLSFIRLNAMFYARLKLTCDLDDGYPHKCVSK